MQLDIYMLKMVHLFCCRQMNWKNNINIQHLTLIYELFQRNTMLFSVIEIVFFDRLFFQETVVNKILIS